MHRATSTRTKLLLHRHSRVCMCRRFFAAADSTTRRGYIYWGEAGCGVFVQYARCLLQCCVVCGASYPRRSSSTVERQRVATQGAVCPSAPPALATVVNWDMTPLAGRWRSSIALRRPFVMSCVPRRKWCCLRAEELPADGTSRSERRVTPRIPSQAHQLRSLALAHPLSHSPGPT
jgi:hypothetical protein